LGGKTHGYVVPALIVALSLAIALPAVGAPPHRLVGGAVSLVSSPAATKSASPTKTAKKALKTAKAADKRGIGAAERRRHGN
jgi:hypothetical protein